MNEKYDAIICGGGPVGLIMALSLIRSMPGARVGLCDRRPLAVPKDHRASALSAAVRLVLEGLGIWNGVAGEATEIKHMRITDSGRGDLTRPVFLSFDGDVAPGRAYAHMLSNRVLAAALLAAVTDKVDLFAPVELERISHSSNGALIALKDGRRLESALIIGADGAQSFVRKSYGIATHGHQYGQNALAGTVGHGLEHNQTAYEHFRPQGPFASLPLPGNQSSIVWCEQNEDARAFAGMPAERLAAEVEAAMGSVLGKIEILEPLQVFTLQMQIAKTLIGGRMALIGDAAHVVHPIAGQGLNLGIKDVAALAEVVVEAMRLGEDHGSAGVLERYQRWQRFDIASMAAMTDGLNRLFSNESAALRPTRDFGLGLVDRLQPVKSGLIRHAAGLTSGPRLLRGLPI